MEMLPSSLQSSDPRLLAFCIVNGIFFTGVFLGVVRFRPAFRKKTSVEPDYEPKPFDP